MSAINDTKPPVRVWSGLTSSESAFGRLIVGPVLFISFILSLVLVDQKASDTIFASPTGSPRPADSTSSPSSKDKYYHSHQKKLAKREFEDAFQLRGRVIAWMVMAGGFSVAIAGWTGTKVWSFMLR